MLAGDQVTAEAEGVFAEITMERAQRLFAELLRGEDWAPRSVRDKIKLLERTYSDVEQRLGRPGSDDEVALFPPVTGG